VRTARGAGRADEERDDEVRDEDRLVDGFFAADVREVVAPPLTVLPLLLFVLPALRVRVREVAWAATAVLPLRDVLVLRDPEGEDVRVAMVRTVGDRPTRHVDLRSVSPPLLPHPAQRVAARDEGVRDPTVTERGSPGVWTVGRRPS